MKRPPFRLRKHGVEILTALVTALLPAEPAIAASHERVLCGTLELLGYLPPTSRWLFPLGLWLFEFAPVLFVFAPHRFTRLSVIERLRFIKRLLASRWMAVRMLAKGLRAAVYMTYFDLPEVKAHLGYAPELHLAERARARAAMYQRRGLEPVVEPDQVAAVPAVRSRGGS